MKKRSFSQLFWLLLAVLCIAVLVLLAVQNAHAQTVAPFMGVGNVQELDNNGNVCPSCVLYSYQAGTSTQQATYTDATGLVQNPNPITFGAGGRTPIWLSLGSLYKFVLCVQNDGAACSPGDVLFTVDQVPGGSSSSSGGGSPFTGIFISGSANPASTGVIRLASADTIAWRNAANSANLLLSKDTSDVLSWAGGSFKLPEGVCSTVGVGFDYFCADSTAHRPKISGNGGTYSQIVAAGTDINNSDQVIQLHFGATGLPLSSTAPLTGQALVWNGSQVIGSAVGAQEIPFGWGEQTLILGAGVGNICSTSGAKYCMIMTFVGAHTLTRFVWQAIQAAVGCSPNGVIGVVDLTASTTLYSIAVGGQTGYQDSGALSAAIPAGHIIGVGYLTAGSLCSTSPTVTGLTMVYQ